MSEEKKAELVERLGIALAPYQGEFKAGSLVLAPNGGRHIGNVEVRRAARSFNEKFPTPEGPHGWIQWKGTNACMDVYCACGHHGHVDADFAYNVKCPECGRVYACDGHIKLVELTPEEAAKETCIEVAD